jgi:hypothetical protein
MRKELRELKEIDRYLLGQLSPGELLVFRARLLLSADLRKKLKLQAKTHRLIRWYGRDLQREKLAAIHTQLMAEEQFGRLITSVFK